MAIVPSDDSIEREEFEATRHVFDQEVVTYDDGGEREIYRCEACGTVSEFAGNPDECPVRRERYERIETVGAREGAMVGIPGEGAL